MKITDIHIDGFGVWHELELKGLSPQLTTFYGANEAGKTTLMQFVRSVLYGISPVRRSRYLPPIHGSTPGGSLGIVDRQEPLVIRRIADRGPDDWGHVTVTDQQGNTSGDRLLREAIGDVDEQTFNNVFAVGLREIQQLGTLSDIKAAEWLYRLTSGLDRVSLYDVIQNLRQTRRDLLAGSEQESKLVQLVARRDVLLGEIDQLKQQSRQWAQLAVRIQELDDQIQAHEAQVHETEHRARTLEIAVGLIPNWHKRAKIANQLRQLSVGIELPEDALQRLGELNRKVEQHQRESDILEGQRRQLREDCDCLGINELLIKNSCRIEALAEQRDWLQALERHTDDLANEAEQLQRRLTNERQRLGSALGVGDHDRLKDIGAAEIEDLKPAIEAVGAAKKQVDAAQRQLDLLADSERSLQAKLESAIVGSERQGLPMDIQQASDLVARLRSREQVERRLEQARKHETEMERQGHELLNEQVMPLSLFGWSLAAIVMGGLMVGLWLLMPDSPLGRYGSWLAIVGLGISAFSFLFKYFVEHAAAARLEACHRQLEVLARQIEQAEADKENLDAELSLTDAAAAIRLEAAENHLAELENMLPVEAQRRQAGHEVATAESRFDQARSQLESALSDWKVQLAGLGFSEKLDPQVFLSIADRYESLSDLESRVQHRREEIAQRQREHAAITRRVNDVAREVGCQSDEQEAADVLDQLEHLVEQRAKQLTVIQRREEIIERAKELKSQEGKHRKAIVGLKRRREAMFQAADCDDEIAYRRLAEQQLQARQMRKDREAISREITAAIGTHAPEESFAELLIPERIAQLEELWESASAELEEKQREKNDLVDQRGALRQEQRQLAEDRTLSRRQLELRCVGKQITDARQSWRELATFNRILERTRQHYEAHRQPETLTEATKYMNRLTGGEYTRIWTPLAEDVLLVENAAGESLGVELLSRGTREQLFLSVRLALVACFARRGVNLPMVLDDVLVNFDAVRAGRAAQLLCDFAAAGHQLLVFTCHEHVWQMFKSCDADCRRLPNRTGRITVEPQPEPATEVVEQSPAEVVEVASDPEPIEEATEVEPATFYEYPFQESIREQEVLPEDTKQVEVEATYDWDHENVQAESSQEPLAYILPEDAVVKARSPQRLSHDHLEPRRA